MYKEADIDFFFFGGAAAPSFLLLSFLSQYFSYFSTVNWWVDVSYWWILFCYLLLAFLKHAKMKLLFHDNDLSYPTPILSFLFFVCVSLTKHCSIGY